MRLALVVEYEGTAFHGFQYQIDAPSIQEELEKAIEAVTGERPRVRGAGRTDAGVHAIGQVVAFDTASRLPPETLVRALNAHLPEDIGVREGHIVPSDFDPRRHALSRQYRYTMVNRRTRSPLLRRTACLIREPLDVQAMDKASQAFVGKHDFARFATGVEDPSTSTIRHMYRAAVSKEGEVIRFDIEGSSFLTRQVRRMAGALVDVGRGELSAAELAGMIDLTETDRVAQALSPHGLCLMAVKYDAFPTNTGDDDGNEH